MTTTHTPTALASNQWFVRIAAPLNGAGGPDWLSSNRTWKHWGPKARLTKEWRLRGLLAARTAHLPQGLQRVSFDVVVHFHNRSRSRDADNLQPSWKAVRDGLVDFGLIPDDNDHHVVASRIRAGEVLAQAALSITITEETP